MNANIPNLSIEMSADGLIGLEQQNRLDEPDRIQIHPIHLRHMAEKLGLVRQITATEADALRMVDKLARRIKVLHERILQLDRWLWEQPDHEEADISTEIWYSAATLELSNEFQTELAESLSVRRSAQAEVARDIVAKPRENPDESQKKPSGFRDVCSTTDEPWLQSAPSQLEFEA